MNSSLLNLHGRQVIIRIAHEGQWGETYRGRILDVGPEFIVLDQGEERCTVMLGRRFITSLRGAQ